MRGMPGRGAGCGRGRSAVCVGLAVALLLVAGGRDVACATRAADERAIRAVVQRYVDAWRRGDEAGVLGLFAPDAAITPSGASPIRGLEGIRAFWFPRDSSRTTIHEFRAEILSTSVDDTIAMTSQRTFLAWTWEKADARASKEQWGYAMTILKRRRGDGWRIWRQSWTDVHQRDR